MKDKIIRARCSLFLFYQLRCYGGFFKGKKNTRPNKFFVHYKNNYFETGLMNLKKVLITLIILCLYVIASAQNNQDTTSVIWKINSLDKIGGNEITIFGNPQIVETPEGKAIRFNGIKDGIIVHANPLNGVSSFTLEVLFKPDTSAISENKEQRFVHIQNPGKESRRMLIELRLTDDNKWFLDTHINTDSASRTLYAEKFIHPLNEWYHAALVYENGCVRHFVNGIEEMSGHVKFIPISNGNVSIGMRMNKRSYFKGEIKLVRFTNYALHPDQFIEK